MKAIDRYRVARWSALTAGRRLANRWWDLVGHAAGFCMATTWREADSTYGRGMRHWRCGYLRKAHRADGAHRFGDFLWNDQHGPARVPALRTGVDLVGAGDLPRWLRGRHYAVGTRRRDRQATRAAFDRIRAGIARATPEQTPKSPERLEAWRSGAIAPFSAHRHYWHVHRGREFLFGATIDDAFTREFPADAQPRETRELLFGGPVGGPPSVLRLQHAFTPGQAGTHLEWYCQATADEDDPGPVPGARVGRRCGWPEARHVSRAEAKRIERREVDDIVSSIWGDDDSTKDGER